jgi:LCP family protein required for cell wall assembly
MPDSPKDNAPDDAQERRQSGSTYAGRAKQAGNQRPYNLYRSAPRSLTARLRGESDAELEARADQISRQRAPRPRRGSSDDLPPRRGIRRIPGFGRSRRPAFHPLRLLRYVVGFCIFWVVLSVVLFVISASGDPGDLPGGSATKAALSGGGPILTSANNILILGLDNRPTSGYSSKEGGLSTSDTVESDARTDSIMIWRLGGGTSRKLSIPRDTLVEIPGCGEEKINAAWSCGGPKETIQVIEALTGIKINHVVVVDLGNFVKFIDDIGGVSVTTPKICSEISGGAADGGYTLNLSAGQHHLTGIQAVTLARTRENLCNPAYDDIQREQMQQKIIGGISSQLFSIHAFTHLPWASWDAPKAIQTDMGPLSLGQLFIASEIGGSSKPETLKETGGYSGGQDVLFPSTADVDAKVQQLLHGN